MPSDKIDSWEELARFTFYKRAMGGVHVGLWDDVRVDDECTDEFAEELREAMDNDE